MSTSESEDSVHPEPRRSQELTDRLATLEKEVDKKKRLTLIANLVAVLLGGTGLLGFVQWVVNGPSINKELIQLNVQSKKLESQVLAEKSAQEKRTTELQIIKSKLELDKDLHNQTVNSLKQKIKALKETGGSSAQIATLRQQLADHEEANQQFVQSLLPIVRTQSYESADEVQRFLSESKRFQKELRSAGPDVDRIGVSGSVPGGRHEARMDKGVADTYSRAPQKELLSAGPDVDHPSVSGSDLGDVTFDDQILCIGRGQKVTIDYKGPPDKYSVLFGYVDVEVRQMENMTRLSAKDRRIVASLKSGDHASFITPQRTDSPCVDFQIQDLKLQDKPVATLQDQGEISVVKFTPITSKKGTLLSLVFEDKSGTELDVTWERAK